MSAGLRWRTACCNLSGRETRVVACQKLAPYIPRVASHATTVTVTSEWQQDSLRSHPFALRTDWIVRNLLGVLLFIVYANLAFAEQPLFSFSQIPNNAAESSRPLSADELLVVTVAGIKSGDRLVLARCANPRCGTAGPVAEWTFDNFDPAPKEVHTEGDLYEFLAFNAFNPGFALNGAQALAENGVTTLRFQSGLTVMIEVRATK